MELEDFYQLRIGQELYVKGVKHKLFGMYLSKKGGGYVDLSLNNDCDTDYEAWDGICADCSLEAPKEKKIKRFWLWRLKSEDGKWYKHGLYADEYGFYTDDTCFGEEWEKTEKIKTEHDFVDVEVE